MAQVNGEKRSDVDGRTLAEALAADGLDATRVACELNGRIVGRDAYPKELYRLCCPVRASSSCS
ncbi:sulfur carrier protein ThiS, partial [Eggerthella sinensis]|uniref:sulfur carrier protein ThiS n=1 Tax=Eggerthella sinensis TaxID=242230 RepID=UPI00248EE504